MRPEDDDSLKKPWLRASAEIKLEDVPSKAAITLADGLYIPIEGFSNRAQNQLKRIAAFRNPQFYRSQAMRIAPGTDFSGKVLHMIDGLHAAFSSAAPSFHPLDLCVGVLVAAAIRLTVYVKGKNAKKFRKNTEYGSARWGA